MHHSDYNTFQSHTWEPSLGDSVVNTNPGCKHKGSEGIVVSVSDLPQDAGKTVTYCCTNTGENWYKGDFLTKTMDQLSPLDMAVTEGTSYHLREGIGIDRPIYRPGTKLFFELINEMRTLTESGVRIARSDWEMQLLETDLGKWALYEGKRVPLDFPFLVESGEWHDACKTCTHHDHTIVQEAKYKGKDVELGKPKRGGGKAYVYVRDPKTGNVKKVSFGSSMPDAMGDSDAARKRRKSFGDRHDCANKKDRTKAGYWSCRATKFFGRDIPGWW